MVEQFEIMRRYDQERLTWEKSHKGLDYAERQVLDACIEFYIGGKPWSSSYEGYVLPRGNSKCKYKGVEASGQRSEEATMSLERLGTQNQASVRMEVDSKECHGTAKADLPIVKGRRCEATDSSAMGIATTWYHRDETSIESLISCSHGGRPLIVKGA
ncbi:hypothetical protein B296_00019565 [Ensete ventricosum]|uniref:Uncharacterized protein n=1 Tax=Ensete ventricosum TaxID=4639 RepID=A0A426ZLW4_ENSVE|nr:hypothetical protein B296_00019565 [Ensete ventricosum]